MDRRSRAVIEIGFAVGAGALARGFFPPFVLDEPFWREFWSGPPAAGVFALLGAVVAFGASRVGARTVRRGAERQEWWNRAEWALDLARSDKRVDRIIGLRALDALDTVATEIESAIVLAVTSAATGRWNEVAAGASDDEGPARRKARSWPKKSR